MTHAPRWLIAAWLAVAVGIFAVSALRYAHGGADTMDFGYQAQMMWQISHGHWRGWSSVFQTPALTGDGALTLYPIAYGFRWLGGPAFLFALQALGVVVASAGLYRIARQAGWTPGTAGAVALLFCLYPAILGGTEFDYHPDFIALPFLVWAYAAYQADQRWAYWACLAGAALSKNMACFAIAGWGLGLILYRRQWRDGALTAGGAVALLGAELLWIFPRYFPGATLALNASLYGYLGHGVVGIATGVFTHPGVVLAHLAASAPYALWILGPVLGLALLGEAAVPAFLALYGLNALSAVLQQRVVTGQYSVLLAGWLFIALIEALTRWPAARRLGLLGVTVVTSAFELVLLGLVILPAVFAVSLPMPAAVDALAAVPRSTVLLTQAHLGSLAYRHADFGVDRPPADGHPWLDRLPTLWAAAPTAPTAIVWHVPASPYLSTVVAAAVQAGYRVRWDGQGLVTVWGRRHFAVPPMNTTAGGGWQPALRGWTLPAGTQASAIGYPVGDRLVWAAPRGRAGWLVRPFFIWFAPGSSRLTAATQGRASGTWRCTVYTHHPRPWWRAALDATLSLDWTAGRSVTGPPQAGPLTVTVRQGTWMACGLYATGRRAWQVTALTVHTIGGRA